MTLGESPAFLLLFQRAPDRMESISLIVAVSSENTHANLDVSNYLRVLQEQTDCGSVEVLVTGDPAVLESAGLSGSARLVPFLGKEPLGGLRAAIELASNDVIVVLDPKRSYTPDSLLPGGLGAE